MQLEFQALILLKSKRRLDERLRSFKIQHFKIESLFMNGPHWIGQVFELIEGVVPHDLLVNLPAVGQLVDVGYDPYQMIPFYAFFWRPRWSLSPSVHLTEKSS